MESMNLGHHISAQYNAELEDIRSRVMAMGGLVEEQIQMATRALVEFNTDLAETVIENDTMVNGFEVSLDEECAQILARRQPAAGDLRLIVAVIKTITDLERMGDEAEKVARMAIHLSEMERPKNQYHEIQSLSEYVQKMTHDALDAFARMDADAAIEVAKQDDRIDREYEGIMRQLMTFMVEDPRSIKRVLDAMWAVRALERIGDHAKNICEYIIYLVKGKDVRHISIEQLEKDMKF